MLKNLPIIVLINLLLLFIQPFFSMHTQQHLIFTLQIGLLPSAIDCALFITSQVILKSMLLLFR